MVTEEIIVKSIHPAAEKALAIAEDLFYELEILYGKGRIENFVEENYNFLSFFIIELENEIAACGALNKADKNTAEIKRMFVKKKFRGRGLSKKNLAELEKESFRRGFKKIILETGVKQPEAVSLYEKSGYKRRECYNRFKDDPHSICFEKQINE